MPVKKGPHKKKTEEPKIKNIPDIFDDEEKKETSAQMPPVVVEVENTDVTINEVVELPSAPEEQELPSEEEDTLPMPDLPAPSAPVGLPEPVEISVETTTTVDTIPEPKKNEPSLPKFFTEEITHEEEKKEEPLPPPAVPDVVIPAPTDPIAQKATQMLEKAVPQAFVGNLNEVKEEVKGEKRNMLVTLFIIAGMILVAAGIVGTYFFIINKPGSKGDDGPTPVSPVVSMSPSPTASPTPTPSASPAADLATLKKKVKVNVLNGTKIVGLAAKQASALKKADYTTGTVGNGDPNMAGTITVPTGMTILGQDIQETLSTFTFTIKESSTAKDVTIVLNKPNE